MKYTKYSDFSAAFHSTIKSIKFLNERTEIDVLRHDSSPYPSTARAKLIFHSDARSEWTAITHDTYLKLRQTRRKVLPTAEDHRLYEFYGRAENSKHPNELGQLCQLIERGAGAAIIFHARARRYDFIAAIKSE